jgi:SRSO17 transposase
MKQPQQITYEQTATSIGDIGRWALDLIHLHACIAPRFTRPEPRRRAMLYLKGLLSGIQRKNSWQLAEHAREGTPYGMQRLLSSAVWDTDGVRDDVRSYALEHLGQESAILVLDETSFPKRGSKSAGVGLQYCGTTGQVENCQVGVFLDYVTSRGHALIDRELYLPADWLQDRQRCREASIPEMVRFRTKPELAVQMLERIWKAQLPISWVVADTVYGGNLDLRSWLEQHQYSYILAVACDEPVGIQTPNGRRRVTVAEAEQLLLEDKDWQPQSMSSGTKGPRLFDWARVPILHRWEDDGCHWLLIRRSLGDPHEKRYYFVFAPKASTLCQMVEAIGARWHIEEDFENTKDLGLDHYEVRSFLGWFRHVTLVMLAYAFLVAICVRYQLPLPSPCSATGLPSQEVRSVAQPRLPLLPLTTPEVRHLLGCLIWPPASSVGLVLAWSWWRRAHQRCASYYHTKRRLQAG